LYGIHSLFHWYKKENGQHSTKSQHLNYNKPESIGMLHNVGTDIRLKNMDDINCNGNKIGSSRNVVSKKNAEDQLDESHNQ